MTTNESNQVNDDDLIADLLEKTASKPKKPLHWRIEDLPHGRSRVTVERGALEHTDQMRLSSELQREKFAKACDAKEPGCFDEVLADLEKQATRRRSHYDPRTDEGCRFVFTSLEKIMPRPVDWLWEKYIPAGAVTILEGDPGVGKTMVLADLAARVSCGFLSPDRQPAFDPPGFDPEPVPELVWWFAGHDSVEETLAPRLRAAGANPSLVRIIEGTEDMKAQRCRPVAFPQDFDPLWKGKGAAPRLVIVDPLSSFCGGSLNHQTAVKVLRELAKFAAATGAAVVVVRPLNRRVGVLASERGSAGNSLAAEARSVLLLGNHPNDPQKQVLAAVKCNLCAKPSSLELQIVESSSVERHGVLCSPHAPREDRKPHSEREDYKGADGVCEVQGPQIAWLGHCTLEADELLQRRRGAAAAPSPFEQKKVEEWLGEKLKSGPKAVKEIDEQAKLDDVPPILLRRAKISLGVVPSGSNGSTKWSLPELAPAEAKGALDGPSVEGAERSRGKKAVAAKKETSMRRMRESLD